MPTRLLAALLLALPLLGHAAPPAAVDHDCGGKMSGHAGHGPDHAMGHQPMPPFLRGAALSDSQKDQIFKLLHDQAPALRDQGKVAHQAMDELHKLGQADKFDETRAKALAATAARAHGEIALLHAKAEQQIYALLTPEQRSKIDGGKNSR